MKRGYRTARRSMKRKPVKKTPVRGRKAMSKNKNSMPKTKKAMPKRTKKSMPKTKKSMPKAKKPKSKSMPKSKPKSRSKSVHSSVKYSDVRKCIVLFKKYGLMKSSDLVKWMNKNHPDKVVNATPELTDDYKVITGCFPIRKKIFNLMKSMSNVELSAPKKKSLLEINGGMYGDMGVGMYDDVEPVE